MMVERYNLIHCLSSVLLLIANDPVWGQTANEYYWGEKNCPEENSPMMATEVPWGVPGRAYKTLPFGLVIAPSKISGAGFGVISQTFIPKYTWLGLYDGEIVGEKDVDYISWYTFMIYRGGETCAFVDGFHLHLSSYHRYINAPTRHRDENVIAALCYSRIYLITNKDIPPGAELLLNYGPVYMMELGIDLNLYFEVPKELLNGGFDLNEEDHRTCVDEQGFELSQVKDVPLSWLFKCVLRKDEGTLNTSFSEMDNV